MDELPDLSASIGRLLEDPEMLGKALNVATALKSSGMLDGLFEKKESIPSPVSEERQVYSKETRSYTEEKASSERTPLPPARVEQDGWNGRSADRKALLLALRPYMSRDRQERIDSILRILELLDLAGKLGSQKL